MQCNISLLRSERRGFVVHHPNRGRFWFLDQPYRLPRTRWLLIWSDSCSEGDWWCPCGCRLCQWWVPVVTDSAVVIHRILCPVMRCEKWTINDGSLSYSNNLSMKSNPWGYFIPHLKQRVLLQPSNSCATPCDWVQYLSQMFIALFHGIWSGWLPSLETFLNPKRLESVE